jgi:FtsP/CotA-like multicopper oxidase with cupredoxin domain
MRGRPKLSRRDFMSAAAAAASGAVATSPFGAFAEQAQDELATASSSSGFNPDVDIELRCEVGEAQILGSKTTAVWRYVGELIKGPKSALTSLPDSYLGPLLRFWKGQKVRIRLRNALPESTITHWHGLHVPMAADGHPRYAIDPGETYIYEFEIRNRAGFYFYHPHTHEATATQVYRGLAGAIIVNDEEEKALELPSGEFELPIVLQDRSFGDDNELVYAGNMHSRMIGFAGDRILVNGRPNYALDVASGAYRLRIVNGSNSRVYKLAWDDATPLVVIGVDGGLLEKPEEKPYAMLAPGERLDVWVDLKKRAIGSELALRSAPFRGVLPHMARMGMRMGMGMTSSLPVGDGYKLFTLRVTRAGGESPPLPQRLASVKNYRVKDAANPENPIPIAISEGPMSMLLNGRPYGDNDVQSFERVPLGSLQLVEIFHDHGGGPMGGMMGMMGMGMGMGGMFAMAHPIHLHGQQFQILGRSFDDEEPEGYASVREGFISSGFKDTVLVMPGERVRILKPFDDFKGSFMYHCHNLEHEDMGMMRAFSVE